VKLYSDPRMCRTLVLAMETGSKGVRTPYLFRSYPFFSKKSTSFNRNPNVDTGSFRLIDVCRATSAAPQYFKSLKIESLSLKFRDGSDWSMNPSLEAYREIKSIHHDVDNPIDVLLSVGCGEMKRSRLGSMLPGRTISMATWEDMAVEGMINQKSEKKEFHYYRLAGPSVQNDVDDNEWRNETKGTGTYTNLRDQVAQYCESHSTELRDCAESLVSLRRRRAETYQWEEFAFGNKYQCHLCEEADTSTPPPEFECRADFIDHLRRKHESPPETEEFLPEIQRIVSRGRTTSPLGVREPQVSDGQRRQNNSSAKALSSESPSLVL